MAFWDIVLYRIGFVRRKHYDDLADKYADVVEEYQDFVDDMKTEFEITDSD